MSTSPQVRSPHPTHAELEADERGEYKRAPVDEYARKAEVAIGDIKKTLANSANAVDNLATSPRESREVLTPHIADS